MVTRFREIGNVPKPEGNDVSKLSSKLSCTKLGSRHMSSGKLVNLLSDKFKDFKFLKAEI